MKAQCVILAGGIGSRMKPYTEKIPKAMIPVNGRPFVELQLRWLKKCGIEDIVLSIGYFADQIMDFVRDGSAFGVNVRYSNEENKLRGTGGAVRWVLDQGLLQDKFLLTYGDSFLPIDFGQVWRALAASEAPALMTINPNQGEWDKSNVWFENGEIKLYEKSLNPSDEIQKKKRFIDYGLLGFQRKWVEEEFPMNEIFDLSIPLHKLSKEGRLEGLVIEQRYYEIGSPTGLEDFKDWLIKNEKDFLN